MGILWAHTGAIGCIGICIAYLDFDFTTDGYVEHW